MTYSTLAFAVMLECLRSGDWATASALTSILDSDALAERPPQMRGQLVSRPLGVEGEAWVQRRLKDSLCSTTPPERPTFRFVDHLPLMTFSPKSGAGRAFDKLAAETNEAMSRLVLGPDVAKCSCGATYIAATWERLELVGRIDDRDEGGMLFEQRNCVCGSTMTRELVP
jgi:hypothetical protein